MTSTPRTGSTGSEPRRIPPGDAGHEAAAERTGARQHTLPPLPYAMNALEPVISAQTLSFHYGKHHKAYVDKVNELIAGTPFAEQSLEAIVLRSANDVEHATL